MEYLKSSDVLIYLADATNQLLKNRGNYPTKASALSFYEEYFRTLKYGRHVLFRNFDFIMATQHNRVSFVQCVHYCIEPADGKGATASGGSASELLSVADYFNCITMICKDFPLELVEKAVEMLVVDRGLECRLPFADFMRAFKLQVVFNEFLAECRTEFAGLAMRSVDGRVTMQAFLGRVDAMEANGSCKTIPIAAVEKAVSGLDAAKDILDIFNALVRCSAVHDAVH